LSTDIAPFVEEERVVVVGRAAEQLDVERALALLEPQLVDDRIRCSATAEGADAASR